VLAGPGSGKTATLVIKVAHLLSGVLHPPSGLACITFNNDAVREFRNRLSNFGIYSSRRLFLGTVHSFCLNCVIRPYAGLVDSGYKSGVTVAGPKYAEQLLDRALSRSTLDTKASYYIPTMTRLRRRIACGETIAGFDDRDITVLKEYEKLLTAEHLIDFEWIVTLALELIQENVWIQNMLSARFPWLIVDEYQDLGGPLHRIIMTLVDNAGIKVFAVGDPDQTIYDFTGAHPRYLDELLHRTDFKSIRLKFNYRSGQRLIDASQAALSPEKPRGYASDPKHGEQGEIIFVKSNDHLEDHAAKTIDAVRKEIAAGTPPEEIAIFYQKKTILLNDLRLELDNAGISYIAERDSQYPTSPVIRWLQDAAGWAVSMPTARQHLFENLFRYYADLLMSTGKIESHEKSLDARIQFYSVLFGTVTEEVTLRDWIGMLDEELKLRELLALSEEHSDDLEALENLFSLTEPGEQLEHSMLVAFASDGRVKGKVALTTFHSSKGRQFDAVIIPGLVEGIIPPWTWNWRKSKYEAPAAEVLGQTRRLFYVGFTRARKTVYLVYSKGYVFKGHPVSLGVSRFAIEISEKLKTSGKER
jgi:DNA helicase-2/ATP-dependent DNA helicase PcrA